MTPELRFNQLKNEWVLFSQKRSDPKKPRDVFVQRRTIPPKDTCPFEDMEKSQNQPPYFKVPERGSWKVLVFPNKFPGLDPTIEKHIVRDEPFRMSLAGYGYHDVLITKSHTKNFSDLPDQDAYQVLHALRKRYLQVSSDPHIDYISMFQNWGVNAGASIYHPHMQIISLPVIPSHIAHELVYSLRYFEKSRSCLYCDLIQGERKEKKRIVYENKDTVAFVPYAAQEPYEVLIFPKQHAIFFEQGSDAILRSASLALKKVLGAIKKKLGDPDYNFYIHTAPATDGGIYEYHHWYIRVLPKTNIDAGFELGTGVQLNAVFPEDAAKLLKTK
jgi:UDPglucose--hexose-1-phosphate uridylyltransferase